MRIHMTARDMAIYWRGARGDNLARYFASVECDSDAIEIALALGAMSELGDDGGEVLDFLKGWQKTKSD